MARKYVKKNTAYWASKKYAGSKLEEYHKITKAAKESGDVEYQKYVKAYYRVSRYERKHKVKIGKNLHALDYENYLDTVGNENLTNFQIVRAQFKSEFQMISPKAARLIQEALRAKGVNLTLQQVRAGQLGKKVSWQIIDEFYIDLIHGTNFSGYNSFDGEGNYSEDGKPMALNSQNASKKVSQFFFGSD